MPNTKAYLSDPRVTTENLTIDDETKIIIEDDSRVTLRNTTISKSNIRAYAGNITIDGGAHTKLEVTTYSGDETSNVCISGNIHTKKFIINPLSNITLAGSCKLEECAVSGSFELDIESLGNENLVSEVFRYDPNDVDTAYADGWVWHNPRYCASSVSVALLEGAYNVRRFCVYPNVHVSETCLCGLCYPLLLEGHALAVLYYIQANPNLTEYYSMILSSIPQGDVKDAVSEGLDDFRNNRGYRERTPSKLKETLTSFGINDLNTLFREP